MVKRNAELLRRIADVIEKDVGVYDQSVWGEGDDEIVVDDPDVIAEASEKLIEKSCGTAHCIAGHAAVLSGYKPVVFKCLIPATGMRGPVMAIEINWEELTPPAEQKGEWTSDSTHPFSIGRDLLGLSFSEAEVLFDEFWCPAGTDDRDEFNGTLVAEALRGLAAGASIYEVTDDGDDY